MTPTLYALCQKAIVGPALWVTGQCTFPPPLPETGVKLDAAGLVLSQAIEIPVSKGYFLSLGAEFASIEDRLNDRLIGSRHDLPCYGPGARQLSDFPVEQRQDLGQPVRLQVTILSAEHGTVAWKADLASLCAPGHDLKKKKLQVLALAHLAEGKYRVLVHNVEARPDLAQLGISLTLHSGVK